MKINLLLPCLLALAACNSPKQENQSQSEHMIEQPQTLKSVLDEKKSNFASKADSTKKRIYAEGIESVVTSNIVQTALQIGDTAIDFSLINAAGDTVSLYQELAIGPVILMWYRGGWCPYCNLTLRAMQDLLPDFKKKGASLLALTPEAPDKSLSTKEKNELEFEVLNDINNNVAREYGVVFKLTEEVKAYYEKGFGLSDYNGNDNAELPLGATYIIGQDGVISYAFLDADYRNRAEPSEILETLTH